jgi:hypothetical protein
MAIELDSYANAITSDLPPLPEDDEPDRIVLHACPEPDISQKTCIWWTTEKPHFDNCSPREITIDIHFKFVLDGVISASEKANITRRRDKQISIHASRSFGTRADRKQMAYFQSIYTPYKIFFRYNGQPDFSVNKDFTNHFIFGREPYQVKTRVKGPNVHTVWLVRSLSFNGQGELLAVSSSRAS